MARTFSSIQNEEMPIQESLADMGRGENNGAWDRGVDSLQASLYGFASALGGATGVDILEEWGAEGAERNLREIAENPAEVHSWDDVDSLADFGTYWMETLGEQAPQLLMDAGLALATGGAGAIARRTVMKEMSKKKLAEIGKKLKRMPGMEKGYARFNAAKGKVPASGLAAVQKVNGKIGNLAEDLGPAAIGLGMSNWAQNTGETQNTFAQRGIDQPGTALLTGAVKASLDMVAPARLLGIARKLNVPAEALPQVLARVGKEAGISATQEGATEAAQTLVDQLAVNAFDDSYDLFSPEGINELWTAGTKGALVGGTLGASVGGVQEGRAYARRKQEIDQEFDSALRSAMDLVDEQEGRAERDAGLAARTDAQVETPAATVMEPEGQDTIDAQAAAMGDPTSSKDTMEVTGGSPQPNESALPEGTIKLPTQNGVAYTTNQEKADLIAETGGDEETMGQVIFNAPGGKRKGNGQVVVAQDARGNPIFERATNDDDINADIEEAMRQAPEGGDVGVATQEEVIQARMTNRGDSVTIDRGGDTLEVQQLDEQPEEQRRSDQVIESTMDSREQSALQAALNETIRDPKVREGARQVLNGERTVSEEIQQQLMTLVGPAFNRILNEDADQFGHQRADYVPEQEPEKTSAPTDLEDFESQDGWEGGDFDAATMTRDIDTVYGDSVDYALENQAPEGAQIAPVLRDEVYPDRQAAEAALASLPEDSMVMASHVQRTDKGFQIAEEFVPDQLASSNLIEQDPQLAKLGSPNNRRVTEREYANRFVEASHGKATNARRKLYRNMAKRAKDREAAGQTRIAAQIRTSMQELVDSILTITDSEGNERKIIGTDLVTMGRQILTNQGTTTQMEGRQWDMNAFGAAIATLAENGWSLVEAPGVDPVIGGDKNFSTGRGKVVRLSELAGADTRARKKGNDGYTVFASRDEETGEATSIDPTGDRVTEEVARKRSARARVKQTKTRKNIEELFKGVRDPKGAAGAAIEAHGKLRELRGTQFELLDGTVAPMRDVDGVQNVAAAQKQQFRRLKRQEKGLLDQRDAALPTRADGKPDPEARAMLRDMLRNHSDAVSARERGLTARQRARGAKEPDGIQGVTGVENAENNEDGFLQSTDSYLRSDTSLIDDPARNRTMAETPRTRPEPTTRSDARPVVISRADDAPTAAGAVSEARSNLAQAKARNEAVDDMTVNGGLSFDHLETDAMNLIAESDPVQREQAAQISLAAEKTVNSQAGRTIGYGNLGSAGNSRTIANFIDGILKSVGLDRINMVVSTATALDEVYTAGHITAEERKTARERLSGRYEDRVYTESQRGKPRYKNGRRIAGSLPDNFKPRYVEGIPKAAVFIPRGRTGVIVINPGFTKKKDLLLSIVGHEVGHGVYNSIEEVIRNPRNARERQLQQRLFKAYRDDRENDAAYSADGGFKEWFADKVAAQARGTLRGTSEENRGLAGRLFQSSVEQLRGVFNETKKNTHPRLHPRNKKFENVIRAYTGENVFQEMQNFGFGDMENLDLPNPMTPKDAGITRRRFNMGIDQVRQLGARGGRTTKNLLEQLLDVDSQMRIMKLNEIADLISKRTGTIQKAVPYWTAVGRARGEFIGQIQKILPKRMDESSRKLVFWELAQELPTSQLSEKGKELRKVIKNFHQYLLDAGLPIGEWENYFPRSYNTSRMTSKSEDFIQVLVDSGWTRGKAIDLHQRMTEQRSFRDFDGYAPKKLPIQFDREIDTETARKLMDAGFLNDDPYQALTSYIAKYTREAEHRRIFGGFHFLDGYTKPSTLADMEPAARARAEKKNREALEGYLSRYELVPDDYDNGTQEAKDAWLAKGIEDAQRRGLAAYNGEGVIMWLHPDARLDAVMERVLEERTEGMTTEERQAFTKRAHKLVDHALDRADPLDPNTLQYNMIGEIRAYESLRTLAFSGIASVPEVAAAFSRARGEIGIWEFRRVIWETATNGQEIRETARIIGASQDDMGAAMATEMWSRWEDGGKGRVFRNMLPYMFKFNGNDAVVNYSRAVSLKVGMRFLEEAAAEAQKGSSRHQRYLDELDIDIATVQRFQESVRRHGTQKAMGRRGNSGAARDAKKVRDSLNTFIDESVLRPNASERPTWASHPVGTFIFHLKTFAYSFNKRIVGGLAREMETRIRENPDDPVTAAADILYMTVPMLFVFMAFGAVSDELRNRIKSLGHDGTWGANDGSILKTTGKALDRTGLFTSMPFFDPVIDTLAGNPNMYSASFGAGPTASHLWDLLGDKGITRNELVRSIPGISQTNSLRSALYE